MKGSLQLSINAIVVLILAIAMLGVGMFFIKSIVGGEIAKLPQLTNDIKEQIKDQVRQSDSKMFISGLDGKNLRIPLKGTNDNIVIAANNKKPSKLIAVLDIVPVQDEDGNSVSSIDSIAKVVYEKNTIKTIDVNSIDFWPASFESKGGTGREIWKATIYECAPDNSGNGCDDIPSQVKNQGWNSVINKPNSKWSVYAGETFFVNVQ